jgi:RNA polymerase sigma-70 factor, ECF subfamily
MSARAHVERWGATWRPSGSSTALHAAWMSSASSDGAIATNQRVMAETVSFAETDDVGIVIAVARYVPEALAEAYRRHAGAVFGLAQRMLWDRGTAEEMVQEVFLRLWERPERFDRSRGSLRSFLLMDTHARCVDRIRADARRRDREDKSTRAALAADYDVSLEAWDLSVGDQVREAMSTLSDGERDAIELAYFGGHTYRDVARMLQQPEGTVKSRIRTGLMRLRQQLLDRGIDESWIVS